MASLSDALKTAREEQQKVLNTARAANAAASIGDYGSAARLNQAARDQAQVSAQLVNRVAAAGQDQLAVEAQIQSGRRWGWGTWLLIGGLGLLVTGVGVKVWRRGRG